jgi:hypothetical protein
MLVAPGVLRNGKSRAACAAGADRVPSGNRDWRVPSKNDVLLLCRRRYSPKFPHDPLADVEYYEIANAPPSRPSINISSEGAWMETIAGMVNDVVIIRQL